MIFSLVQIRILLEIEKMMMWLHGDYFDRENLAQSLELIFFCRWLFWLFSSDIFIFFSNRYNLSLSNSTLYPTVFNTLLCLISDFLSPNMPQTNSTKYYEFSSIPYLFSKMLPILPNPVSKYTFFCILPVLFLTYSLLAFLFLAILKRIHFVLVNVKTLCFE